MIYRPFINYAVSLFLFLSGYLTNAEITDTFSFCKKRITRILIPYVIWSVLYTLEKRQPERLIWNLLTTRANYPFYYVSVYIQFVLLTPFLKKVIQSPYRWIGWTIAPVSTFLFSYMRFFMTVTPNRVISFFWSVNCLTWFTAYYLGLALGNHVIQKIFHAKKILLMYILSIPVQMLEGHLWFLYGDENCGTQIKLSAFLTNALFLLLAYCYLTDGKKVQKARPLILLGDCSFGIFLCHMMWIHVLNKVPVYSYLPYLAKAFFVTLFSFVSVTVGKKICGEKWSKWFGLI